MSVFQAYSSMDRAIGLDAEIAARLRDLLTRRIGPVGRRVESAVQAVERAVAGGLSFQGLKERLIGVRAWLRRDKTGPADPAAEELEQLIERVLAHGRTTSIENYGAYVFTVDVKF